MHSPPPDFGAVRALVAGDVMLDRYWHGDSVRLSPEAPVPVLNLGQVEERLGGAANVALNLGALGASARLAGIIGRDSGAETVLRLLDEAGLDHHLVQCPQPTIIKLRMLARHQQLLRVDTEQHYARDHGERLTQQVMQLLPEATILILSDYAKGSLSGVQELIAAGRKASIPVLIDPKGTDFRPYRGATLMTPNLAEFQAVAGNCADLRQLTRKGQEMIQALQLKALLITRSEQGMSLLDDKGETWHLPARTHEVFDSTGAGDTVIATLAAALGVGMGVAEAARLANQAAGIAVSSLGAAQVSRAQLFPPSQDESPSHGIVALQQAEKAVQKARGRGERLVMTNGCFDLLHAGHVAYLEQARSLGDRLLVAVNDDASTARLKGPGRPVNPLSQRMRVLAALRAVDWVVGFAEDTPENLLRRLRPELLVKGGDYSDVSAVVGHQIVQDYGGEVQVLSQVRDCSSSTIIQRIRNRRVGDSP